MIAPDLLCEAVEDATPEHVDADALEKEQLVEESEREILKRMAGSGMNWDSIDRDQPTIEDELDELIDELGDPITKAVLDGQYDWIREHYGDEAADCANYGWGSDGTDEPLVLGVATKVYGHGILETTAQRAGSGFEVRHHFIPFGSEADIAAQRAALEQTRQWFEAGGFDADPRGAPPGRRSGYGSGSRSASVSSRRRRRRERRDRVRAAPLDRRPRRLDADQPRPPRLRRSRPSRPSSPA